jgi:hypothetical protein
LVCSSHFCSEILRRCCGDRGLWAWAIRDFESQGALYVPHLLICTAGRQEGAKALPTGPVGAHHTTSRHGSDTRKVSCGWKALYDLPRATPSNIGCVVVEFQHVGGAHNKIWRRLLTTTKHGRPFCHRAVIVGHSGGDSGGREEVHVKSQGIVA